MARCSVVAEAPRLLWSSLGLLWGFHFFDFVRQLKVDGVWEWTLVIVLICCSCFCSSCILSKLALLRVVVILEVQISTGKRHIFVVIFLIHDQICVWQDNCCLILCRDGIKMIIGKFLGVDYREMENKDDFIIRVVSLNVYYIVISMCIICEIWKN